eukprot:m.95729 g.95729  ORF g.95729 m.95729 type:complete len:1021 (-) comp16614_c0_seq1:178-3240(-)
MSMLEGFRIEELLGEGGFATVYKAFDTIERRHVALKLIDKKAMKTEGMRQRVQNEVEIHSRLDHPAILKMYNFFETDNFVCLVLEYAALGSIKMFLSDLGACGKPLDNDLVSPPEHDTETLNVQPETLQQELGAARVLAQVVSGLQYLHRNGILHRDLSPANLLVTASREVKIADFGLAVLVAPSSESTHSQQGTGTKTGLHAAHRFLTSLCGTAYFIAPELLLQPPAQVLLCNHGATDVWALGCLLHTMLTGAPPFVVPVDTPPAGDRTEGRGRGRGPSSTNLQALFATIATAAYTPPATASPWARDLLQRLLVKSPRDRLTLNAVQQHPFLTRHNAPTAKDGGHGHRNTPVADAVQKDNTFVSHASWGGASSVSKAYPHSAIVLPPTAPDATATVWALTDSSRMENNTSPLSPTADKTPDHSQVAPTASTPVMSPRRKSAASKRLAGRRADEAPLQYARRLLQETGYGTQDVPFVQGTTGSSHVPPGDGGQQNSPKQLSDAGQDDGTTLHERCRQCGVPCAPTPPANYAHQQPRQRLRTQRLRPAKFVVGGATVQILQSGDFTMELPHNRDTVGATQHQSIVICRCGQTVAVTRGPPLPSALVSADTVTGEASTGGHSQKVERSALSRRFHVSSLPLQVIPLYDFATKIVDMVKARTPKITYHTTVTLSEHIPRSDTKGMPPATPTGATPSPPPPPTARRYRVRCMLMEDAPVASFDVRFYTEEHLGSDTSATPTRRAEGEGAPTASATSAPPGQTHPREVEAARVLLTARSATVYVRGPSQPRHADVVVLMVSRKALLGGTTSGQAQALQGVLTHTRRLYDTVRRMEASHIAIASSERAPDVQGELEVFPMTVGVKPLRTARHEAMLVSSPWQPPQPSIQVDTQRTPQAGTQNAQVPFVLHCAFVPQVGWGFALASGATWVLCLTGAQLVLNAAADRLVVIEAAGARPRGGTSGPPGDHPAPQHRILDLRSGMRERTVEDSWAIAAVADMVVRLHNEQASGHAVPVNAHVGAYLQLV